MSHKHQHVLVLYLNTAPEYFFPFDSCVFYVIHIVLHLLKSAAAVPGGCFYSVCSVLLFVSNWCSPEANLIMDWISVRVPQVLVP